MRLLVYELRPPALEQEGLVGALQQRIDAVEGRADIQARLLVEGEVSLEPAVEEALYSVGQEALNNALKHASAGTVTIRIEAREDHVEMEIVDDGRGFDHGAVRQGGGQYVLVFRPRKTKIPRYPKPPAVRVYPHRNGENRGGNQTIAGENSFVLCHSLRNLMAALAATGTRF
jgi:hypothetical protein